jgi:hypothetical protein
MITASCHCGQVTLEIESAPAEVMDCNCSICRRYGTLTAHYSPRQVRVSGDTETYVWGDKMLAFHRCTQCGCVTHSSAMDATSDRMGVNANLMEPEVLAKARVRHFDGADTWKYLD